MIDDFPWEVPIIYSPKAYVYKEMDTREFLKTCLKPLSQNKIGEIYGLSGSAISLRLAKVPEFSGKERQNTSATHAKISRFFNYKKCCRCAEFLNMDIMFGNTKDPARKDGKVSQCKLCQRVEDAAWTEKNPEARRQQYDKIMNDPNLHVKKIEAVRLWKLKTNYRGRQEEAYLARRPSWVDMPKMVKIIKECPIGYHVDHIIPMKGELVSGLDIPTNLQYLSATENMSKGNRFTPCSYEDIPKGIY
jgi:hypothetical protein